MDHVIHIEKDPAGDITIPPAVPDSRKKGGSRTFYSFFFTTYPGWFLQSLPVALTAGFLFWFIRYRQDRTVPLTRKIGAVLFVCYLTELFCLVCFLRVIGNLWHLVLYRRPRDMESRLFVYRGLFKFVPDFWRHWDREKIGNVAAFLPLGILLPLARPKTTWPVIVLCGFLCSLTIETIQPAVGRTFDVNDLILNTFGTFVAATVFFLIRGSFRKAFARKEQRG